MKSMLMPYFDYGLIFTTCVTRPLMNKFQVLYNACIRTCFKIYDARDVHVKDLYTMAGMLPIDLRRIYLQLTTCYRLVFNGLSEITNQSGTRATGAPTIRQTMPKLSGLINGPIYQAHARWNALEPGVRWLSKDGFKIEIKKRLQHFFRVEWRADTPQLFYEGKSILQPVPPGVRTESG